MKLRLALIVLISTTLISSCSTLNKTVDSIGGLFSKKEDKCDGPDCETPSLIDNEQTAKKWHCYGQKGTEDWQCQTEADDNKIIAIQPEPPTPRNISRLEATKQTATTTQAPGTIQTVPMQAEIPAIEKTISTEGEGLLDQPAGFFTIQLIALPEESEVLAYAEEFGIKTPLTARINSQGIPWHVLLLDIYPNKRAAEQAEAEWVVEKTLKVKPWIRQLGPLQDAIREASGG